MEVTPSTLDAMTKAFNTLFNNALKAVQSNAGMLASTVPSSTRSSLYAYMLQLPRMREWLGERFFHNVSAKTYELINRKFELSIDVDRDHIEDDQLGVYTPMIAMMGDQAQHLFTDLLIEALEAGAAATSTTFDAVAFFSASHPVDPSGVISGTQSNLHALALSAADFDTVRVTMANLKGADGKRLGVRATHLIVPTALETTGETIVTATMNAAGATNVYQGKAKLVVMPELTSDTAWYVADLSKPFKPLVSQVRRAPDFVSNTAPDSPRVFSQDKFSFGSSARGAAGYGLWQLIAKSVP